LFKRVSEKKVFGARHAIMAGKNRQNADARRLGQKKQCIDQSMTASFVPLALTRKKFFLTVA
jgi:hypothetical protein